MQGLAIHSDWDTAMRRGDFAAAWRINDTVLAGRDIRTRDDPALPYHERWVWDGTPPDGQDVLVRCYHGLGDTLQFSRYLPMLDRRAARLRVEAQPELLDVLDRMPGMGELIAFDPAAPLPAAPCTLEIMEAAHVLRCAPGPAPPFRPRPAEHPGHVRVGACWIAGGWDPDRSLAAADTAPLASLPVEWTSLQGASWPIAELATRVLPGLHLVITVDTMMAHLAGSLGVPTWLLLKAVPDWRWMDHRSDSPWYPSVRLFRQRHAGDWSDPVRQVVAELALVRSSGRVEPAPVSDSHAP